MAGEKKRFLDLPIKLILTQEGSTFFITRKKRLLRIKLADNVEEYGIALDKFDAETLQRLLLADYVAKIEISKSEFVSSRAEIMDLAKLIVYSVVYKQYDDFIFKEILGSPEIKRWNRLNPANIIDEKTRINEQFLARILKENEKAIYTTKQEILSPLYSFINKNDNFSAAEKNIQLLLGEKFLNNLRPFTWFVITKFKGAKDFDLILRTLRTGLVEYMDKTKIAEYIALMLMELILSAENMNLRKEALTLFPDLADPQQALFDPTVRGRLVESLERKKEFVFVSWRLWRGNTLSIGTQGKLQVTLYSKNQQTDVVRANLNDLKNTDVTKNSLIDFYRMTSDDNPMDGNMGLAYISYLSEACEKVNVRFESSVSRFERTDLTVMNLSFMF